MRTVEDQLKEVRTAGGKTLYEVQLGKARMTAIVLAAAAIVSLIFLTFAFIQKGEADAARLQVNELQIKLRDEEKNVVVLRALLEDCRVGN